jgi:hypothetical protein
MEGIHGLPVPVRLKADLNFAVRIRFAAPTFSFAFLACFKIRFYAFLTLLILALGLHNTNIKLTQH